MERRMVLHQNLRNVVGPDIPLYFQPPVNLDMVYPCVRYEFTRFASQMANNRRYFQYETYEIMVIDPDPESSIYRDILEIPFTSFDRTYTVDDLHHFIITAYVERKHQ